MPNWRFWEKQEPDASQRSAPSRQRTATAGGPIPRPPPPHPISAPTAAEREQRLKRLLRRREAAVFDVEQAEKALQPDNPWRARMALLAEALQTVETDRRALADLPKVESVAAPATRIEDIEVTIEEPPAVSFRVGAQQFRYEEDLDWAERGRSVVQGDLRLRTGDAAKLVPSSVTGPVAAELAAHLEDSFFVFATDLRDRVINGEPLPAPATLADLAQPCPECGGWRDWRGTCPECKQRAFRRQHLDAEAVRLESERAREEEERAKRAERLPVARRRLADVDAEIAALGG